MVNPGALIGHNFHYEYPLAEKSDTVSTEVSTESPAPTLVLALTLGGCWTFGADLCTLCWNGSSCHAHFTTTVVTTRIINCSSFYSGEALFRNLSLRVRFLIFLFFLLHHQLHIYSFFLSQLLNLYQSRYLLPNLIMLHSRYALFIIPLICLLSAIFYIRHNPSQFYNSKISESNTVPKDSSLQNATTIDQSSNSSEPRIVQVSMLFGEQDNEIYQRCLDTHFEHGKRWGYRTHVLRQEIRTNKYFLLNKPLYVLSYLLTEMAKKPHERAAWLM